MNIKCPFHGIVLLSVKYKTEFFRVIVKWTKKKINYSVHEPNETGLSKKCG